MVEFELTGPRGDNPLGFLTALGALVTLEDAGWKARLGWVGVRPRLLAEADPPSQVEFQSSEECRRKLSATLYGALHRKPRNGKPADPTVALGKNLTQPNATLLSHIDKAIEAAQFSDRRGTDLAAAYGVANPSVSEQKMLATPWALVSGSGGQDFLGSVEKLMTECEVSHFDRALFGPWVPQDELYSLRLDVLEDRRYALMDRDPTASGNKPRTLWGANRLAFEALRLFPAMPDSGGMAVRAWRLSGGNWRKGCVVRWPLWSPPISAAVVGSLLGLSDCWREDSFARERLRALGVFAVYESGRLAVGEGGNVKYNLAPPVAVWRS